MGKKAELVVEEHFKLEAIELRIKALEEIIYEMIKRSGING